MGISPFSHWFEDEKPTCVSERVIERVIEKPVYVDRFPNPDPLNWILNKSEEIGSFLIIDITYPDCVNYEGRKLMLYKWATVGDLVRQEKIDPHFSSNKKLHSPIARFEPTEYGWKMARILAKELDK